ncbi:hypothetical protein HGRIS_001806 [Hohenbuehelia grisea]|uniref:Bromo domain-containing protein n=1 Tax=Hohenbuehelia grisea TaxID=104357 RepID=A0ABR3JII3_9AGAR
MLNLLRTLTESHIPISSDGNLKLLLTSVKESRRQNSDTKLVDPFYDSLEGLLIDLRTISIDNRDAEAFLRPVQRSEVPDYYEVIANPMDLQTMLKKVKQKSYKSKKEFKDDLDLIWSNCYTYNAVESHPLRQAAKRLKVKAERLLRHITDRKERMDPAIPADLLPSSSRPRLNGFTQVNGHLRSRTPTIKPSTPLPNRPAVSFKDVPFQDTPAIIRTADCMGTFLELDRELDTNNLDMSKFLAHSSIFDQLPEFNLDSPYENESFDLYTPDGSPMNVDESTGEKRKLNGAVNRPRKRARFSSALPDVQSHQMTHLWWRVVHSEDLVGNGLPAIAYPTSASLRTPKAPGKRKRRKDIAQHSPQPKSLLSLMNKNISSLRRVRQTHTKYAALNLSTAGANEDGEGGAGADVSGIAGLGAGGAAGFIPGVGEDDAGSAEDNQIDERPWLARWKGKGPIRGGIDIGAKNADSCLRWMGEKVLEHAGFQGTSEEALDVFTGVATEYLLNVGRTLRFMCDKYSHTMSPEEITLHALFESGVSEVQDLERYISDDVERYGTRLGDLEKKLVNAYREATAGEVLDEDGFFEEDEEEEGALVMGNFADAFGDDFLGLRELGIAAEHGLSTLTIPKRLFKPKKGDNRASAVYVFNLFLSFQNTHSILSVKPAEPPLPYPLPPPLIPLDSSKIEDQIGLLRPYYMERITALTTVAPTAPTAPPPPNYPGLAPPGVQPSEMPAALGNLVTLPDDMPTAAQAKMGPLGQIVKGAPAGSSKKKKASAPAPPGPPNPSAVTAGGAVPAEGTPGPSPKKKGATGVGRGNGGKKKPGADGQGEGQSSFALPPPVIAASA